MIVMIVWAFQRVLQARTSYCIWFDALSLVGGGAVIPVAEVLSETDAELVAEVDVFAWAIGGTPPRADKDGLGECAINGWGGKIGFVLPTEVDTDVNRWFVDGAG